MSEIPDKSFYRIGEVCDLTDTQPYVLRFWESEFPQLTPRKNRSGHRVYRREDVDLVMRIKELLYEEEFTIAGARKRLDDDLAGGQVKPASRPDRRAAPVEPAPRERGAGLPSSPPRVAPVKRSSPADALQIIEELRARLATMEQEKKRSEAALEEQRQRSLRIADSLEAVVRRMTARKSGRRSRA